MLKGHVYIHGLVPLELNARFQSVCYQLRVIDGHDYGVTFERVVRLGLAELVKQRRIHDLPAEGVQSGNVR